ncbi:hypothetical protein FA15DRAFT_705342 [Coprinopsis marcescibilis]|uniref:F-box domain-containing protein n=1 Tax=Coprinopsis marcescibilis TaxID=230819 RepID=A0A5C3KTG1_COPMA|nr:hypothetical protein FA15DRAFT_705342 [Coprinopsis marcescibilis]
MCVADAYVEKEESIYRDLVSMLEGEEKWEKLKSSELCIWASRASADSWLKAVRAMANGGVTRLSFHFDVLDGRANAYRPIIEYKMFRSLTHLCLSGTAFEVLSFFDLVDLIYSIPRLKYLRLGGHLTKPHYRLAYQPKIEHENLQHLDLVIPLDMCPDTGEFHRLYLPALVSLRLTLTPAVMVSSELDSQLDITSLKIEHIVGVVLESIGGLLKTLEIRLPASPTDDIVFDYLEDLARYTPNLVQLIVIQSRPVGGLRMMNFDTVVAQDIGDMCLEALNRERSWPELQILDWKVHCMTGPTDRALVEFVRQRAECPDTATMKEVRFQVYHTPRKARFNVPALEEELKLMLQYWEMNEYGSVVDFDSREFESGLECPITYEFDDDGLCGLPPSEKSVFTPNMENVVFNRLILVPPLWLGENSEDTTCVYYESDLLLSPLGLFD